MPFQAVGAPVTNIETVTESVPYLFRNLGFWPCISGEQYPPARAGNAAYATNKGLPAIVLPGASAGAQSEATWPQFPKPAEKSYVEITANVVMIANGATGPSWTLEVLLNALTVPARRLGLQFTTGGSGPVLSTGDAAFPALPAAYNFGTWIAAYREVVFRISPTVAQILIDGVLVVDLTPAQAAVICPSAVFSAGMHGFNPNIGVGLYPVGWAAGVQTKWL
jgi:hypothetical protein